jgi:hypothetical protein
MVYAEQLGLIVNANIDRPAFFMGYQFCHLSDGSHPAIFILAHGENRAGTGTSQRGKIQLISRVSSDYTFESVVDDQGNGESLWVAGAFEKMTGYTIEEYIASRRMVCTHPP